MSNVIWLLLQTCGVGFIYASFRSLEHPTKVTHMYITPTLVTLFHFLDILIILLTLRFWIMFQDFLEHSPDAKEKV